MVIDTKKSSMSKFQDFKLVKISATKKDLADEKSEINKFIERFNKIAKYFEIKLDQPLPTKYIDTEFYVWKSPSNIHVVGRGIMTPKLVHYQINDEGKELFDINISRAYRKLNQNKDKNVIIPDLVAKDENIRRYTSSALIYVNPKYINKTIPDCIQYDLNKAYCHALRFNIPDTTKMRECDILKENEIGFRVTPRRVIHIFRDGTSEYREVLEMVTKKGYGADFVFPSIPSPFIKYVETMERELLKAKELGDKAKEQSLKAEIVCAVGNYQNHNPFIRANVVEGLNNQIKSLIDEDTIYCNTDSIVSRRIREDLVIGKRIGEWKIEAMGNFRCFGDKGANYMFNDGEKKSCRGPQNNPKTIVYDSKLKRFIKK